MAGRPGSPGPVLQPDGASLRLAVDQSLHNAPSIEGRIAEAFGIDVVVLLRTPAELAKVARGNPFLRAGADPSKLHVVFLSGKPATKAAAQLDPERSPPGEFRLEGREIYLHLPTGFGRSKLTVDYFERRSIPFVVGVNCFEGATRYPSDAVRHALDLDESTPVVLCDAREKESVKEVLIDVVEHAMAIGAAARQPVAT